MRMSRKAGLIGGLRLPTLPELWAAAAIIQSNGYTDSSPGTCNLTVSDGASSPFWVFCSTGKGICFAKVKGTAQTYLKTVADGSPTAITVAASGSSGITVTSGEAYGIALFAFRFTGIKEKAVDKVLSGMTLELLASRNQSGNSTVRVATSAITSSADHLYLQSIGAATPHFSICSGVAPDTAVVSDGSRVFWRLNSNYYYLSSTGSTNSSIRSGSICHLV